MMVATTQTPGAIYPIGAAVAKTDIIRFENEMKAGVEALAQWGDTLSLTNVTGTANAAVAEKRADQTELLLNNETLLTVQWPVTNTASDPTLTIGGSTFTIRRFSAGAVEPGELIGGRRYLMMRSGTQLRLIGAPGISDVFGLSAALAGLADHTDDLAQWGDTLSLTNVSGTANAAVAEKRPDQTDLPVYNETLLTVQWPITNTASDPTLTIGSTTLTVRRFGAGAVEPGELVGGRRYLMMRAGTQLRLIGAPGVSDVFGMSDVLDAIAAARVAGDQAVQDLTNALAQWGDTLSLTNVSGTANAAIAAKRPDQEALLVNNETLLTVQWPVTNTATDPTLTIGSTSLTVRRFGAGAVEPGELVGGRRYLMMRSGTQLRLIGAPGISDVFGLSERVLARVEITAAPIPHIGDAQNALLWSVGGRLGAWDVTDALARRILDRAAPRQQADGGSLPHIASGNDVVLWSANGRIGARDVTDGLARRITDRVAPRLRASGPIIPLMTAGPDVIATMLPDGIDAPVSRRMADRVFAHRPAPAMSDGRTLHRWRGRMGAYRAGTVGARPRLLLVGDSWIGAGRIPGAIASLFATRGYDLSADGWHPPYQFSSVTGVVVTRSTSWDAVDGSAQTEFPYGAGPDGQGVTTTLATPVLQYANLRATDIDIHSFGHGGTWRYQIDGGAWTVVAEAGDGLRRITQISGLTDEPHVLRIETVGNTATVSIAGINSWRTGVDGPQVIRFGDSGTAAVRSRGYLSYTAQGLLDLPPDLLITVLGTNDQNFIGSPPQVYADYLNQLTAAARAANPDVGILHILPPRTNVSVTSRNRLMDYLPAIRDVCEANNTEYLSLYSLWGTWAQSDAAGLMNDNLHLNEAGANVLAHTLNRHFLEV